MVAKTALLIVGLFHEKDAHFSQKTYYYLRIPNTNVPFVSKAQKKDETKESIRIRKVML